MNNIDEHIRYVGEGWHPLIKYLNLCLFNIDNDYNIVQVKEKFGGLRFYFETSKDYKREEMVTLVNFVEGLSYRICETCGKEGTQTGKYWVKTTCKEHEKD